MTPKYDVTITATSIYSQSALIFKSNQVRWHSYTQACAHVKFNDVLVKIMWKLRGQRPVNHFHMDMKQAYR